ncbi:HD domain-containing protein [Streptococcus sp. S784/96/1]|uniref:HD domain-containing protein n=1 Tax=Streptococcus sp. S784/96/1 TaxID=2653499 RepID=UPI001EE3C1D7|nr:HD domain-containing protein [Streptococcus sp. S784/96/1]
MTNLQDQWRFFNEVEKLKTITRQNQTLDNRFENSAEHSWQLALMAITLREYFSELVNMEKVMLMLLLHDVGEIGVGDTSVFDEIGKLDSYERELASVTQTFSFLPMEQKEYYLNVWQEFEKGNSVEARYARCVDAIAPLMNHLLIAEKGDNPDGLTKNQVLAKKAFIEAESPDLWQWVLDMIDQSVEKGLYLP